MGLCHVLNIRETISSWNDPFINTKYAPLPSMGILVDFMPHEKVNPEEATEGQFLLASPYDITDPSLYGEDLHPGNIYMVTAIPVEKFLLPPPYTTKCEDYISQWKKKNYTGPLGLDSCVSQCFVNYELEFGNCILYGLWYPHKHRLCNRTESAIVFSKLLDVDCYQYCKRPCYSLDFETEIKLRTIKDYTINQMKDVYTTIAGKNMTKDMIRKRFAQIVVYFRKPEIYSYTYNAKYEAIEIFSYLGGYLGMWLGLSLLSIYESLSAFLFHFKLCGKKKKTIL